MNPILPSKWDWEPNHLVRNSRYRVVKPFTDADGDTHGVGEEWVFISATFSKFDDLLTLCLRRSFDEEWTLPLLWKKGEQEEVIEDFGTHMKRI